MASEAATVTLDKGEITVRVDVSAFIERLAPEDLARLAQSLTFRDEVFNAVADRLITGSTTDGYWQGESEDDIHERHRLRLLAALPDVERRAVELLIKQRERLRAEAKALATWAWRTYHRKNEDRNGYLSSPGSDPRVSPPEWFMRVESLTEEEVAALYDDVKREAASAPAGAP